jgi:hypothetical protein
VPFPEHHLYLTLHWSVPSEPLEAGQCGFRFHAPAETVTQGMVDALKSTVSSFWSGVGAKIPNSYQLQFLRLAPIGTDGKYPPGTIAYDGVFTGGVNGGVTPSAPLPMSISIVSTLLTPVPRGQAATGRVYLPPIADPLGTNMRWTTAVANNRSAAVASMLTALNAALVSPPGGLPANAAVYSRGTVKSTTGLYRLITGVKTGTKPDVQRRRAKRVAEAYGSVSSV